MADFQWPEPTNEQLRELQERRITELHQDMRGAIALDRRLLAGIDREAAFKAWKDSFKHHAMPFGLWILTRGGTVEPLSPPVPTLAEALEATQFLAGEAAGIVIRYLQAQQQQQEGQG